MTPGTLIDYALPFHVLRTFARTGVLQHLTLPPKRSFLFLLRRRQQLCSSRVRFIGTSTITRTPLRERPRYRPAPGQPGYESPSPGMVEAFRAAPRLSLAKNDARRAHRASQASFYGREKGASRTLSDAARRLQRQALCPLQAAY